MKKIQYSLFILLILLLCPVFSVWAGYNVNEKQMANGLRLLTYENDAVPLVAVAVVFNVGSKNEPAGLSGITRICNFILQSGTRTFKRGEYSRIVQAGGGTSGSNVDVEQTWHITKVPSDMLDTVLYLWADRLQNSESNQEKLLMAKDAVRKERVSSVEGSIYGHINEEFMNLAYRSHPYGNPIYGWPSDVDNVGPADVKKYARYYFQPGNITLIIAGDFKTENVVRRVDSLFSNIISIPMPFNQQIQEPDNYGERHSYLEGSAGIPAFIIGYHIPPTAHEDTPTLRLLSYILSGSESSRIQKRLIAEEGAALYVGGGLVSMKGPGLLYTYAVLNHDFPYQEGEARMSEEIRQLVEKPITDAELQSAKNQLEAAYFRGMRTLDELALSIAYNYNMYSDCRWLDSTVVQARRVTAEDIQEAAEKYFKRSNRIVVFLNPISDEKNERSGER